MKIWNTAKVSNIPSNIAKIWAGNWQYWSNFCALPALGVWFIFSYMLFILTASSSDMKIFYKCLQGKKFGKHCHIHLWQWCKNVPKILGTGQTPRRQLRVTRRNFHMEEPPPPHVLGATVQISVGRAWRSAAFKSHFTLICAARSQTQMKILIAL